MKERIRIIQENKRGENEREREKEVNYEKY